MNARGVPPASAWQVEGTQPANARARSGLPRGHLGARLFPPRQAGGRGG